jgi:hypothetical protein
MGMVPVAPNHNKELLEGANNSSGFADKPKERGLRRMDITNRTTLVYIIVLTRLFVFRYIGFDNVFFPHDPGLVTPQYGQTDSSKLMSFLQLGHRIERFSESCMITT